MSAFDPLDFFSDSVWRLQSSLHALLRNSQSSLQLHIGGKHVKQEEQNAVLQVWVGCHLEEAHKHLVELLSNVLVQTGKWFWLRSQLQLQMHCMIVRHIAGMPALQLS